MPRKRTTGPRTTGPHTGAKRTPRDARDAIIDAALALAGRQGFTDTTLADIAEEAGVGLAEVQRQFGSKGAILTAFVRRIDAAVVAGTPAALAAEPPRDRLFDVLMRRFDALAPHKDAVRALVSARLADPLALAAALCRTAGAMGWMLEAARIPTGGARGRLRVKALTLGYAAVLRTWLRDDSDDHAKTMAALDRLLRRGETMERCLAGLCARRRKAGAEPAAA
ncbi:MAG: TetR family transcriptional regulator [Alphaproteobacteria bacterium]